MDRKYWLSGLAPLVAAASTQAGITYTHVAADTAYTGEGEKSVQAVYANGNTTVISGLGFAEQRDTNNLNNVQGAYPFAENMRGLESLVDGPNHRVFGVSGNTIYEEGTAKTWSASNLPNIDSIAAWYHPTAGALLAVSGSRSDEPAVVQIIKAEDNTILGEYSGHQYDALNGFGFDSEGNAMAYAASLSAGGFDYINLGDILNPSTITVMEHYDALTDIGNEWSGLQALGNGSFILGNDFGVVRVQPVPAPAAAGLLGLAGIVASRRRR